MIFKTFGGWKNSNLIGLFHPLPPKAFRDSDPEHGRVTVSLLTVYCGFSYVDDISSVV